MVTFFVDGNPIGTAAVDAATGQAVFGTTSTGRGTHVVTATYSGDSNFQPTLSSTSHIIVSTASTQSILTVQTVRNKRGKIVSVNLASQVLVVSPGSGVPTGTVTYFRNGRKITTRTLSNATAVLAITPNQALNQSFTLKYSGDASFNASASSRLVVTKKAVQISARPPTAFFTRGRAPVGVACQLVARASHYSLPLFATDWLGLRSFMTSWTATSSWRSRPARLSSGVFST